MSSGTGTGDNRWLLYVRVRDGQLLVVEVVLVQRPLATNDELHSARHLLVDARRNGNQRRRALLVALVLGIAGNNRKQKNELTHDTLF